VKALTKDMENTEVLCLKEAKLWSELLEKCRQCDIHFTSEYMKIFEKQMDGKAMAFVQKLGKNFMLYPFFLRRINDLPFFDSANEMQEEYFDIVSPWYFGGPVFSTGDDVENEKLFLQFIKNFEIYCKQKNIVSEFTRFHPILKNHEPFLKHGEVKEEYDVAYVNLQQSKEEIWKNFKKSNRNAITKAKKNNVEVFHGGKELVDDFYRLYIKTMDRQKAGKFYYFPKDFFLSLFDAFEKNSVIFVAKHGEKTIAASLILFKCGIVHYWLSGSDSDFMHLCPNNIMLYEAILWFKKNGNKIFLLMGGSNPSLRQFKFSFTNTLAKFYTYRKIHNQKIYDMLCKKSKTSEKDYFPAYRA